MAVLIFAENIGNDFKKSTLEAVNYGKKLAGKLNTKAVVFTTGNPDTSMLSKYGADKILVDKNPAFENFDTSGFSRAISNAAGSSGATAIIFSNNYTGKALAGMVAVKTGAALVSGAIGLPETDNGFIVKKSVFSGKAIANVEVLSDKKVIAVNPNSIEMEEIQGLGTVEEFDSGVTADDFKVKVTGVNKVEGEILLEEADLVVSGGRGLKGPENWGMIEELAHELGAATACSRPVADSDWRPHHEHVGQTGGTIRPNLYIAIGISGAIQHLAGVNQSKVIVVINKDPEAPFFKAADYGIVGDAFEVVPKLVEAAKIFKAQN
jgi:electron transfer flavoprotein alpha subunit